MVSKLVSLAAALVLAAPLFATEPTQAERRKIEVEVALALAIAEAPVKATPVPVSKVKSRFNWFGDDQPASQPATVAAAKSCPCGPGCKCDPGTCPAGCPAKVEPVKVAAPTVPVKVQTYHYETRCMFDSYGRKVGCQQVIVPD